MGCRNIEAENPPVCSSKFWGGFSMRILLFVVAQKCVLWYIINEKGQPPTRWVARLVKMEIPPLSLGQSVRAVFLCSNYFLSFKVTMNVSNAMINSPKIIRS